MEQQLWEKILIFAFGLQYTSSALKLIIIIIIIVLSFRISLFAFRILNHDLTCNQVVWKLWYFDFRISFFYLYFHSMFIVHSSAAKNGRLLVQSLSFIVQQFVQTPEDIRPQHFQEWTLNRSNFIKRNYYNIMKLIAQFMLDWTIKWEVKGVRP